MTDTVLVAHGFPVGATVEAFPARAYVGSGSPTGAPVDAAVVMSDGSLTFDALEEGVAYVGFAGGRAVQFYGERTRLGDPSTDEAEGPAGVGQRLEETQRLLNGRLLAAEASVVGLPVNVRSYGARGLGLVDEITQLEAARDAAGPGGTIELPEGVYLVSRPLLLLRGQTLLGRNSPLWWEDGDTTPRSAASRIDNPICVLKPTAGFTGHTIAGAFGGPITLNAVVLVVGSTQLTGEALPRWSGAIKRVGIEGDRVGGTVDGLMLIGQATDWHLEDVEIANCTGSGLRCLSYQYAAGQWHQPQNLTLHRCHAHNNAADGYLFASAQDTTLLNCWGHQNGGSGYRFSGFRHGEVLACKAEWNGTNGFRVDGDSEVAFSGCRTDCNEFAGFGLYNAGSKRWLSLVGCQTHRDGRNGGAGGGDSAGVLIEGTTPEPHGPVHIVGLTQTVGAGEFGDTGEHPQNGVYCRDTGFVYVDGAIRGVTTALKKALTNQIVRLGPGVRLATGPAAVPVVSDPMFEHEQGIKPGPNTYLWPWGRIDLLTTDGSGGVIFAEQASTPGAPGANQAMLFARDNGAGKTQLCVRFPTGAVQVVATEP